MPSTHLESVCGRNPATWRRTLRTRTAAAWSRPRAERCPRKWRPWCRLADRQCPPWLVYAWVSVYVCSCGTFHRQAKPSKTVLRHLPLRWRCLLGPVWKYHTQPECPSSRSILGQGGEQFYTVVTCAYHHQASKEWGHCATTRCCFMHSVPVSVG